MCRMVIIDDEKWVIKSLISTIQNQQWFELIGEATDGVSGLQLLQGARPELAFVDIQMPGFGGLELMQKAADLGLPTLFIVISGYAEFAYAQKAMFLGALSYCLKPFSKNELLDCMEKAYLRIHANQGTIPIQKNSAREKAEQENGRTSNRLVNNMLHYIDENYDRDISIQNLAELCSINSSYVGQLFRREIGETFSAYLTHFRLEKAVALLRETDKSIADVAAEVGYRDYFYFAKVFKKATGKTPSEFRSEQH